MDVETPLPAAPPAPGAESPAPAPTDGLAARLALESGAAGTLAGPESGPRTFRPIGRPPIHGLYSRAAGSDGKHPVSPPGADSLESPQVETPGTTRVSVPPDVVSKVASTTLCGLESFAQWKIAEMGKRAGLSTGEINPQLAQAQIGESQKALVGELAPLALQEWGLDPQISPTAAIAVVLGPWLFASASAYWTLAALAAEKIAMDRRRGNSGGKAGENGGENPA